MFCPACKAEFRQNFTRCSDCHVDLVEIPSPQEERPSAASSNDRPDQAPPAVFLAWFAPMVFFCTLYLLLALRPAVIHNFSFVVFLLVTVFAANTGGFWMLYQAIRYEKRVGRYVLLSFVPFMFIWYSLVRYPLRREMPRIP
jgi:hypothetical protein